jgi:alkanesulfonate monooxygenase SsuD/methylene tetrahydromethanopterin reductase-like flavin-dependent oxidoreductase (luciferase family)
MLETPELQFGVHLSGVGDPAAEACVAEALGFDMVAVDRDVLNGPTPGLETWTTLTWVAARTSTIRLIPNVLALPNRHPSLVAKMAETLDRLSSGRLSLALGAGAPMNDAGVQALGLTQWSSAERVDATAEPIDVMRGLWTEASFSYSGDYFAIARASMEPKPEHPIPVWVGAYKPRMLELTGQRADGWLPSLFLLEPQSAYRALERIRAAAAQAGRDSDALTYAFNVGVVIDDNAVPRPGRLTGSAEQVAERIAEFVTHGFTCFCSGQSVTRMNRRSVSPARLFR